jgi:hypothetical protein
MRVRVGVTNSAVDCVCDGIAELAVEAARCEAYSAGGKPPSLRWGTLMFAGE